MNDSDLASEIKTQFEEAVAEVDENIAKSLPKLPKIHERTAIVRKAKITLDNCIINIWEEHDLTDAEMIKVISETLSENISGIAKHMIRQERHGDSKPGDLNV